MGFAKEAPVKRDRNEEQEAFRKWMNDKVTEARAKCISKLIECETHRENFYPFFKCGKQKKELADCCVQLLPQKYCCLGRYEKGVCITPKRREMAQPNLE